MIFTSDHGYMIGQHGLWHKGNAAWLVEGKTGYRPNMYDDAIRVPLLVSWPGMVAPGTTVTHAVSNLDICCRRSSISRASVRRAISRSEEEASSRSCEVRRPPTWDDTLFGQYDMHHYQVARMRMIRTPDWKLVRHFEAGGQDELYHLAADPGETHNLADSADPSHQSQCASLAQRLEAWMAQIRDRR